MACAKSDRTQRKRCGPRGFEPLRYEMHIASINQWNTEVFFFREKPLRAQPIGPGYKPAHVGFCAPTLPTRK